MVMAFPRSLDLPRFQPYLEGKMIAQDKASCLPPYILCSTGKPIIAIDATAAPGNKTSFLSALMYEKSQNENIIAFEQDKHRYKTLQQMLKKAACSSES